MARVISGGAPPEGLVFDVQRFSVHDGPGIRTTVFFMGCPLRCRWCQNPEALRQAPLLAFYAERCRGDGACLGACPQGALRPGPARVERARCDGCGVCAAACDHGALQRVGRRVTVEGLWDEVARDAAFHAASGGGVTLSGGEPTRQLEFVAAFARRCREGGLGVWLQTCGAFSWQRFAPHLELFEGIQFDLKAIDPALHRRLTGADNRAILGNARRLVAAGAPVSFRTPLIPGHNDDPAQLAQLAAFLGELGVQQAALLRYHALGEAMLPRVGWPLSALGVAEPARASADSLARGRAALAAAGIEVVS